MIFIFTHNFRDKHPAVVGIYYINNSVYIQRKTLVIYRYIGIRVLVLSIICPKTK